MSYIHPSDQKINEFIHDTIRDKSNLKNICDDLFLWFDQNVKYSRLNAPFFPLQRSDLDVLSMKSGTCGDYSNLLVSVLLTLGYDAGYAYVHRDCYGDKQDHICVSVRNDEKVILIDPTRPYRKWHGFDCPHQEYDLLNVDEFEEKMKKEEQYWTDIALNHGNKALAGLYYAPWIHEEIVLQSDNELESLFFLLMIDGKRNSALYVYYMKYTEESGSIPLMSIISNEIAKYCFSLRNPQSIWDNDQWSEEYSEENIPDRFKTPKLQILKKGVSEMLPEINKILSDI